MADLATASTADDLPVVRDRKIALPPKVVMIGAGAAVVIVLGAFFALSGDDAPAAAPELSRVTQPEPSSAIAAAQPEGPAAAEPGAPTEAAAEPEPTPAAKAAAEPEPTRAAASAPKPAITIAARDIKVRGSKPKPQQVASALEQKMDALEHCYEEALEDKPSLQGKAVLMFTVLKNGKTSAARFAKRPLGNAALERCMLSVVREARFPRPKRPAKVTLPLELAHK
jgi:outer membrane biosynthesis protein TonB